MGNLSKEYFSREDNVFSSHVRKNKEGVQYEQFAGVGCSVLRYPIEEIREYLSLCWMVDVIKNEWVKYDKEGLEIRKKNQSKQEFEGIIRSTESSIFLEAVEKIDKQEKDEEKSQFSCQEKLNIAYQNTQGGLLGEIQGYIKNCIAQKRCNTYIYVRINDEAEILNSNYIRGRKAYQQRFLDYIGLAIDITRENERIYQELRNKISKELCELHTGNCAAYYLEYFLKDQEFKFESPNYIRFFLYKLEEEIKKRKESLAKDIEAQEESIKQSQLNMNNKLLNKITRVFIKSHMKEQKGIYDSMNNHLEKKLEYYCIVKFDKYIHGILENYESFFNEYTKMLVLAERRKIEMEKRFQLTVSKIEHWVCTNSKHLQNMLEQMRVCKEYYAIGEEVSEWFYKENVENDKIKIKGDASEKYEVVKEKWENLFDKYFFEKFDKNIVEALQEESGNNSRIVLDRIRMVKDCASIMVSSCRKPYIARRKYCIYPDEVKLSRGITEVIEYLQNDRMALEDKNGIDVDGRQMIFFEISYGFSIEDIDFFSDIIGHYADYPIGNGIQSYRRILDQFCRGDKINHTPHIDRQWHRVIREKEERDKTRLSPDNKKILKALYMDILTNTETIFDKEEFQKYIRDRFEDYNRQCLKGEGLEIDKGIKEKEKELINLWENNLDKKKIEKQVLVHIEKIYLMLEELLKKWYSKQLNRKQENLEKELFILLESIKTERREWLDSYKKIWTDYKKENDFGKGED